MTSKAAEILASALEHDARAHESGHYEAIGNRLDEVYDEILPLQSSSDTMFAVTLRFWYDWIDASSHDWKYQGPINKEQWPQLAREIADGLRSGYMPENNIITESFMPPPGLWERIKRYFK